MAAAGAVSGDNIIDVLDGAEKLKKERQSERERERLPQSVHA